MCSLGTGRQQVEHVAPFAFALILDFVAEDKLRSRLVHPRIEPEAAALLWFVNRPTGEDLGHIGDVPLAVSAVHA